MNLSELYSRVSRHKGRKRVGRGVGSGNGKTSGRGHKGAKSRSGWRNRYGYAGGQTPLNRRFPKRGFNNKWKTVYDVVNVWQLDSFPDGTDITPELLRSSGVIANSQNPVKVLGDGELTKKVTVKAHKFSKVALSKIQSAGGEVVNVPK